MTLIGNYYVKPTAVALSRAWQLSGEKAKEYFKLKRHALKLRFWPRMPGDVAEADLDWD